MNLIKNAACLLLLASVSVSAAEDIKVRQFKHAGPFAVQKPVISDSLNVNGKAF